MASPSPTSSQLLPEEPDSESPSLETLVSHLLAAKRSLSSVEHVYHANDLVTQTRQALGSHTIITARTTFLQNGSTSQIQILDHVRKHTQSIAVEATSEFDNVISSLDAAESQLRGTLDQLRATIVESSLRPDGEPPRSLVDFVDETGVQYLLGTIKESIDATGDARNEYERSITILEDEISHVKRLLPARAGNIYADDVRIGFRSPVPDVLQSMSEHAQDMADNLESLVKHFDLCVTAIKHTEGGGAAAQKIASDFPDGVGLELSVVDTPLEPISEEEKKDMLDVLQKDASEVDDVMIEIRDRMTDIEADFERVTMHTDYLADNHSKAISAFKLLEDFGAKLPTYVTQSHLFLFKWDDEKLKIEKGMQQLEELRVFYNGFLKAYDDLIIEVGRRKSVETKMAKIRHDALARIEKLNVEDVEERDAFREDLGDFLPVDIWPGLMAPPKRYEISAIDGGASSVPDISASVIQKAIRRVGSRNRESR